MPLLSRLKEICNIIDNKIKKHFPDCKVISIPVADGGEGSVDCFVTALGGTVEKVMSQNPYFEAFEAFYGLVDDGKTAIIEMASCAGLPLVENRKNPMLTTTYGVGQLMLKVAEKGCGKIIIGLGGSCTNDCGCGAAAAVGVKFYNKQGEEFIPTGGTLKDIVEIDVSRKNSLFDNIQIITMCDIDNLCRRIYS